MINLTPYFLPTAPTLSELFRKAKTAPFKGAVGESSSGRQKRT